MFKGADLFEGGRKMRQLLNDFYHGNITPGERKMAPDSELRQAVGRAADCENQLIKRLDKADQGLLEELMDAQRFMSSITAQEGFRLGVRMMVECMDGNDGDLSSVSM